ncbi:hypothetical protein ADUPG1_008941 [Aduncisulcus paluster]|uniref:Ribosomal RNA-processing protein 42 n=1 Tax=Aduncisulcus paluster TaxID=2918883 RepID=A0ABQ5KTS4_9EUKA|nr:hypothetical protein ADUPG1_008941 [Aduncisulcus paluster]
MASKEFILQALKERIRIDGRKWHERRPLKYSFHKDSVIVQSCGTIVSCRTTVRVGVPSPFRPRAGVLSLSISLSQQCIDDENTDRDMIRDVLTSAFQGRSCAVDLESLVIKPHKMCFIISLDIRIMRNMGSVCSVAIAAGTAGLMNARVPYWEMVQEEVTNDDGNIITRDRVKIFEEKERIPNPITLIMTPFGSEFCYLLPEAVGSIPEPYVIDPLIEETKLAENTLICVCNAQKELIGMRVCGGTGIKIDSMGDIVDIAGEFAREERRRVSDILKEVEAERKRVFEELYVDKDRVCPVK